MSYFITKSVVKNLYLIKRFLVISIKWATLLCLLCALLLEHAQLRTQTCCPPSLTNCFVVFSCRHMIVWKYIFLASNISRYSRTMAFSRRILSTFLYLFVLLVTQFSSYVSAATIPPVPPRLTPSPTTPRPSRLARPPTFEPTSASPTPGI